MRGGHVQDGNVVRTTAEIVLGELTDVAFRRPVDPETGWDELEIRPRDDAGGSGRQCLDEGGHESSGVDREDDPRHRS
jgi:hypothetical protein